MSVVLQQPTNLPMTSTVSANPHYKSIDGVRVTFNGTVLWLAMNYKATSLTRKASDVAR